MRWIYPQTMIVAVRRANELEALSSVGRARHAGVEHVHGVGVLRVCKNVMKIPGALRKPVVRINEMPVFASIFAAVDSAFFRLNDRVHAISICSGHRYAYAPQHTARQPVPFEPLPRRAIVTRTIKPAPWAAAGQAPRRALRFPQRGKQNV